MRYLSWDSTMQSESQITTSRNIVDYSGPELIWHWHKVPVTIPRHILHVQQQCGFIERVQVLNWPVYSPDVFLIENVWRITTRKTWQQRPQTVEQLKSYIKLECERSSLSNLQKSASLVPKHLKKSSVLSHKCKRGTRGGGQRLKSLEL